MSHGQGLTGSKAFTKPLQHRSNPSLCRTRPGWRCLFGDIGCSPKLLPSVPGCVMAVMSFISSHGPTCRTGRPEVDLFSQPEISIGCRPIHPFRWLSAPENGQYSAV